MPGSDLWCYSIERHCDGAERSRKSTLCTTCNGSVTAIKSSADCQEGCGNCKASWATAQKTLLRMGLIGSKLKKSLHLAHFAHGVVQSGRKPAFSASFRVFHRPFHSVFRRNCENSGSPSRMSRGGSPVKSTIVEGFPSRGP